jgi:hypothetical protein
MAAKEAASGGIDIEGLYKVDIAKDSSSGGAALVFLVLSIVAYRFFPRSAAAVKIIVFVVLLALGVVLLNMSVFRANVQIYNRDLHFSRNNLTPDSVTCLTDKDKGEIIPAGTRVCVTLHGSWFGPWGYGISPVGDLRGDTPSHANPTTLWTIDPGTQGGRTSESRYAIPMSSSKTPRMPFVSDHPSARRLIRMIAWRSTFKRRMRLIARRPLGTNATRFAD